MTKLIANSLGFEFLVSPGLCIVTHNGERILGAVYATLGEALSQSCEWAGE